MDRHGFSLGVFLTCLAAFALTLRLTGGASSADPELIGDPSQAERHALALQATLRVSVTTCTETTVGSGFVADGFLVTNHHLLSGASELDVDQPIDAVRVPVVAVSPGLDLAIGPAPTALSLRFADRRAVVGDRVLYAGHADGGPTEARNGTVVNRVNGGPYGIEGEVVLLDGASRGGFSGGPVLDESGDLVAVLSGFDRATGLTLAIPSDEVRAFLALVSVPPEGSWSLGEPEDCRIG